MAVSDGTGRRAASTRAPARAPGVACCERKSAVLGLVVIVLFAADRHLRAADRALRSDPAELDLDPQAAVAAALVRHRRVGARPVLARDLRRPRLAAGRASSRSPSRSALGVPIGLLAGYGGRWIDAVISRITDAMLAMPVPDPGHRAWRRFSGPRCRTP